MLVTAAITVVNCLASPALTFGWWGLPAMGVRGNAIAEFDWEVGEILAALDKHGLTQNTLVLLTSDNGPVLDDGYAAEFSSPEALKTAELPAILARLPLEPGAIESSLWLSKR